MAFNLTELIPGITHGNSHVATAAIATGTILVFSVLGRIALGTGEAAIMPAGKISIKGIFETVINFIRGLCETVMGREGVSMAPLFGSLFFFLFLTTL